MPRRPEEVAAAATDFRETEHEREIFQDAPALSPPFQTSSTSSWNMVSWLMAQVLKRITVHCERNAAESSHVPGLRLTIAMYSGHGDALVN